MMLMNVTDNYSYLRATEGKKENIRVIYQPDFLVAWLKLFSIYID
jgi:hypothetical protein